MKLYKGNIVYTKTKDMFEVIEEGYICVSEGKVLEVGQDLNLKYEADVIDYGDNLLIPSFVDMHFHAVQYGNLGIGLDETLLDWLNMYTFKEEEKFSDNEYARHVFESAIENVINSGTTHIVFFSSIHEEATKLLMNLCHEKGLTAYVGKVNMDRNSSVALTEDTDESIRITKALLDYEVGEVKSIVTPRFVPSCTKELMTELGTFASNGYPVQTHISENENEIEWVKSLHPEAKNYLDVYDTCGLLTDKTILAHCVFCTEAEKNKIKEVGAYIAHCPSANLNLTSGIMNVKEYIDRGLNVGLGTDVGAGQTPSIREAMVQAIQVSKVNHMINRKAPILSFSEAFYMATKGGGKYFGKVGSFEVGYDFSMLVVKKDPLTSVRKITPTEQLQRFVYSGGKRDIIAIHKKDNLLRTS
jgi:guanine deaminase